MVEVIYFSFVHVIIYSGRRLLSVEFLPPYYTIISLDARCVSDFLNSFYSGISLYDYCTFCATSYHPLEEPLRLIRSGRGRVVKGATLVEGLWKQL